MRRLRPRASFVLSSYFPRVGSNGSIGSKHVLEFLGDDLPVDIHLWDPISIQGWRRHLSVPGAVKEGASMVSRIT